MLSIIHTLPSCRTVLNSSHLNFLRLKGVCYNVTYMLPVLYNYMHYLIIIVAGIHAMNKSHELLIC